MKARLRKAGQDMFLSRNTMSPSLSYEARQCDKQIILVVGSATVVRQTAK